MQEYCFGIKICRIMIIDYLLQWKKPALISAFIANPDILPQEVFPPTTINLTDLYNTFFIPPLLYYTPFDFIPPLPPKVTPPVATQKLPPTLLTTVLPSSMVSTISVNYLSAMYLPLTKIPSAVPSIHHTLQETFIPVPPKKCILSPMNETFYDILC